MAPFFRADFLTTRAEALLRRLLVLLHIKPDQSRISHPFQNLEKVGVRPVIYAIPAKPDGAKPTSFETLTHKRSGSHIV